MFFTCLPIDLMGDPAGQVEFHNSSNDYKVLLETQLPLHWPYPHLEFKCDHRQTLSTFKPKGEHLAL